MQLPRAGDDDDIVIHKNKHAGHLYRPLITNKLFFYIVRPFHLSSRAAYWSQPGGIASTASNMPLRARLVLVSVELKIQPEASYRQLQCSQPRLLVHLRNFFEYGRSPVLGARLSAVLTDIATAQPPKQFSRAMTSMSCPIRVWSLDKLVKILHSWLIFRENSRGHLLGA